MRGTPACFKVAISADLGVFVEHHGIQLLLGLLTMEQYVLQVERPVAPVLTLSSLLERSLGSLVFWVNFLVSLMLLEQRFRES